MQPTIGRIVHYVMPESTPESLKIRPAVIVQVYPACVALQVFTHSTQDGMCREGGIMFADSVMHSDEPQPGTYRWPPMAPAAKAPAAAKPKPAPASKPKAPRKAASKPAE